MILLIEIFQSMIQRFNFFFSLLHHLFILRNFIIQIMNFLIFLHFFLFQTLNLQFQLIFSLRKLEFIITMRKLRIL